MNYETFKKTYTFPDTPGVYFFKRGAEILYIGKATSLKDRVRSYFMPDVIHARGSRIVDMVTKADAVEYEVLDNVLEALIREAYLIKHYQPEANIKEKDNKSFNFVVVTKESWPRIFVIRERNMKFKDEAYSHIFGPFPAKRQIEEGLKIIRKIFPFRMEKSNHERFYQQLGLVPAVTSEKEAQKEYKKTIKHIVLFLEGKKKRLIAQLEKEMISYAKKELFEKAHVIKKQLFALEHIRDVSLIAEEEMRSGVRTALRIEAYDIAHIQGSSTVGVMTVVQDDEVDKAEYRKFKIRRQGDGNDLKALQELLTRRMTHPEWPQPQVIVIDGGELQRSVALETIGRMWPEVHVVNVVKNKQHKPERFIGDEEILTHHKRAIILANSEAHRFAITYHKKLRDVVPVKNKKKRA